MLRINVHVYVYNIGSCVYYWGKQVETGETDGGYSITRQNTYKLKAGVKTDRVRFEPLPWQIYKAGLFQDLHVHVCTY